jgi:hypothetical protein
MRQPSKLSKVGSIPITRSKRLTCQTCVPWLSVFKLYSPRVKRVARFLRSKNRQSLYADTTHVFLRRNCEAFVRVSQFVQKRWELFGRLRA